MTPNSKVIVKENEIPNRQHKSQPVYNGMFLTHVYVNFCSTELR